MEVSEAVSMESDDFTKGPIPTYVFPYGQDEEIPSITTTPVFWFSLFEDCISPEVGGNPVKVVHIIRGVFEDFLKQTIGPENVEKSETLQALTNSLWISRNRRKNTLYEEDDESFVKKLEERLPAYVMSGWTDHSVGIFFPKQKPITKTTEIIVFNTGDGVYNHRIRNQGVGETPIIGVNLEWCCEQVKSLGSILSLSLSAMVFNHVYNEGNVSKSESDSQTRMIGAIIGKLVWDNEKPNTAADFYGLIGASGRQYDEAERLVPPVRLQKKGTCTYSAPMAFIQYNLESGGDRELYKESRAMFSSKEAMFRGWKIFFQKAMLRSFIEELQNLKKVQSKWPKGSTKRDSHIVAAIRLIGENDMYSSVVVSDVKDSDRMTVGSVISSIIKGTTVADEERRTTLLNLVMPESKGIPCVMSEDERFPTDLLERNRYMPPFPQEHEFTELMMDTSKVETLATFICRCLVMCDTVPRAIALYSGVKNVALRLYKRKKEWLKYVRKNVIEGDPSRAIDVLRGCANDVINAKDHLYPKAEHYISNLYAWILALIGILLHDIYVAHYCSTELETESGLRDMGEEKRVIPFNLPYVDTMDAENRNIELDIVNRFISLKYLPFIIPTGLPVKNVPLKGTFENTRMDQIARGGNINEIVDFIRKYFLGMRIAWMCVLSASLVHPDTVDVDPVNIESVDITTKNGKTYIELSAYEEYAPTGALWANLLAGIRRYWSITGPLETPLSILDVVEEKRKIVEDACQNFVAFGRTRSLCIPYHIPPTEETAAVLSDAKLYRCDIDGFQPYSDISVVGTIALEMLSKLDYVPIPFSHWILAMAFAVNPQKTVQIADPSGIPIVFNSRFRPKWLEKEADMEIADVQKRQATSRSTIDMAEELEKVSAEALPLLMWLRDTCMPMWFGKGETAVACMTLMKVLQYMAGGIMTDDGMVYKGPNKNSLSFGFATVMSICQKLPYGTDLHPLLYYMLCGVQRVVQDYIDEENRVKGNKSARYEVWRLTSRMDTNSIKVASKIIAVMRKLHIACDYWNVTTARYAGKHVIVGGMRNNNFYMYGLLGCIGDYAILPETYGLVEMEFEKSTKNYVPKRVLLGNDIRIEILSMETDARNYEDDLGAPIIKYYYSKPEHLPGPLYTFTEDKANVGTRCDIATVLDTIKDKTDAFQLREVERLVVATSYIGSLWWTVHTDPKGFLCLLVPGEPSVEGAPVVILELCKDNGQWVVRVNVFLDNKLRMYEMVIRTAQALLRNANYALALRWLIGNPFAFLLKETEPVLYKKINDPPHYIIPAVLSLTPIPEQKRKRGQQDDFLSISLEDPLRQLWSSRSKEVEKKDTKDKKPEDKDMEDGNPEEKNTEERGASYVEVLSLAAGGMWINHSPKLDSLRCALFSDSAEICDSLLTVQARTGAIAYGPHAEAKSKDLPKIFGFYKGKTDVTNEVTELLGIAKNIVAKVTADILRLSTSGSDKVGSVNGLNTYRGCCYLDLKAVVELCKVITRSCKLIQNKVGEKVADKVTTALTTVIFAPSALAAISESEEVQCLIYASVLQNIVHETMIRVSNLLIELNKQQEGAEKDAKKYVTCNDLLYVTELLDLVNVDYGSCRLVTPIGKETDLISDYDLLHDNRWHIGDTHKRDIADVIVEGKMGFLRRKLFNPILDEIFSPEEKGMAKDDKTDNTNIEIRKRAVVHQILMGSGKSAYLTPLLIIRALLGTYYKKQDKGRSAVIVLPKNLLESSKRILWDFIGPLYGIGFYATNFVSIHSNDKKFRVKQEMPSLGELSVFVASDDVLKERLVNKGGTLFETFRESIMIFDEADTLFDATASEFNLPQDIKGGKHTIESIKFIAPYLLGNKKCLQSRPVLKLIVDTACEQARHMQVGENFGFGSVIEQVCENSLTAIPWAGAKNPQNGSQFTDEVLRTVLTYLCYTSLVSRTEPFVPHATNNNAYSESFTRFRMLADYIHKEVLGIDDCPLELVYQAVGIIYSGLAEDEEVKKCIARAAKYPDELHSEFGKFADLMNERSDDKTKQEYLQKRCETVARTAFMVAAIEYITVHSKQYNTSMLEFAHPNNSYMRTMFSGTVNVHVCRNMKTAESQDENNLLDERWVQVGVKGSVASEAINMGSSDMGYVASALDEFAPISYVKRNEPQEAYIDTILAGRMCSGGKDMKNCGYTIAPRMISAQDISGNLASFKGFREEEQRVLNAFMGGINANESPYDALIDVAGILRTRSAEEYAGALLDAVRERIGKPVGTVLFVYRMGERSVMKINKSISPYQNEPPDSFEKPLLLLYDQKSTVGIDFEHAQYQTLRGLVTLKSDTTWTQTAQGVFRLRKVGKGHTIDFYVPNAESKELYHGKNGSKAGENRLMVLRHHEEGKLIASRGLASAQYLKAIVRGMSTTEEGNRRVFEEDVYHAMDFENDRDVIREDKEKQMAKIAECIFKRQCGHLANLWNLAAISNTTRELDLLMRQFLTMQNRRVQYWVDVSEEEKDAARASATPVATAQATAQSQSIAANVSTSINKMSGRPPSRKWSYTRVTADEVFKLNVNAFAPESLKKEQGLWLGVEPTIVPLKCSVTAQLESISAVSDGGFHDRIMSCARFLMLISEGEHYWTPIIVSAEEVLMWRYVVMKKGKGFGMSVLTRNRTVDEILRVNISKSEKWVEECPPIYKGLLLFIPLGANLSSDTRQRISNTRYDNSALEGLKLKLLNPNGELRFLDGVPSKFFPYPAGSKSAAAVEQERQEALLSGQPVHYELPWDNGNREDVIVYPPVKPTIVSSGGDDIPEIKKPATSLMSHIVWRPVTQKYWWKELWASAIDRSKSEGWEESFCWRRSPWTAFEEQLLGQVLQKILTDVLNEAMSAVGTIQAPIVIEEPEKEDPHQTNDASGFLHMDGTQPPRPPTDFVEAFQQTFEDGDHANAEYVTLILCGFCDKHPPTDDNVYVKQFGKSRIIRKVNSYIQLVYHPPSEVIDIDDGFRKVSKRHGDNDEERSQGAKKRRL